MFLSDQDLVAQSAEGNLDAFEELVKKYESKVYTIAYRLLGNHADAADVAQEAFIKIYRALPKFRGDSSFQTWMYHIVTNACKDELRKKLIKPHFEEEQLEELEGKNRLNRSTSKTPEEELLQKEEQSEIQRCLNTLSVEHRLVLILREIQGFSYEEIAKHLDCSLGTVKSRINRARLAFKDVFLKQPGKEAELWIVKK